MDTWIERLQKEVQQKKGQDFSVTVSNDTAFVCCATQETAREFYYSWAELPDPKGRVLIHREGRICYKSEDLVKPKRSVGKLKRSVLESHRPMSPLILQASGNLAQLLQEKKQDCTVAVHRRDAEFTYLAVQPYRDMDFMLAKPASELIGRPATVVSSYLADVRLWALRAAVRSQVDKTVEYAMPWNGAWWKKRSRAYLYERDPEYIIVETYCGEDWQYGALANYCGVN